MTQAVQAIRRLAIGGALALCVASGCGSDERAAEPLVLDANAWFEEVERAHVVADTGSPAEASAVLRKVFEQPVPPDVLPGHRRVVAQDLVFRIARAELDAGHFEEAVAAADRGLAVGGQPDMFVANLYIVRGEALERLGRDTEAASAYYEALEINRKLLHHVLEAPDAGPP